MKPKIITAFATQNVLRKRDSEMMTTTGNALALARAYAEYRMALVNADDFHVIYYGNKVIDLCQLMGRATRDLDSGIAGAMHRANRRCHWLESLCDAR